MSVILKTPSNGSVTITPENTASNFTLTVPAGSGVVARQGSAFRAWASSATSMTNSIVTKLLYVTENFDTNSCYDTSLSRFTPNVAGVYLFNATHYVIGAESGGYFNIWIQKNGSQAVTTSVVTAASGVYKQTTTCIIDANGTTDYFEVYGQHSSGATRNSGTGNEFYFAGSFLRPL